jgi:hypothetical protein
MPPPNEPRSDLEQRLANVVLAEVLQKRTRAAAGTQDPATARFVRGTLDEGDTLPFELEEPFTGEDPTQPSAPYALVAVEQEVEFSVPFERPVERSFEAVAISASSNLVMDTAAVVKIELDEAPAARVPVTKKMRAATAPKTRATTAPNTRAKTAPLHKNTPSYFAMVIAMLMGALAFILGLGLARLMM